MKSTVKDLLKIGVYDQNKIFDLLYPTYRGHYSRLREIIHEVKCR